MANKSKRARRSTAGRALFRLSLIVFLLIAAAVCVYVALDMRSAESADGQYSVYLFRGDQKIRQLSVDNNDIRYDGNVILLNPEVLTDYCGYTIAGDGDLTTIAIGDDAVTFWHSTNCMELSGQKVFLDADLIFEKNALFVPLSFYETYLSGLGFEVDEEHKRRYIDVSAASYALNITGGRPEETLSMDEYYESTGVGQNAPTFRSDLSAYEEYMNPADRDKYLFLVNYDHKLDRDYLPEDLCDLADTRRDGRTTQQMSLYAAKAMEAMFIELRANGYTDLSVTSAYRSYSYQQLLFDNQVSALRSSYGDMAETKAAEAVAVPGTSEHQSGLCADLHNLSAASQQFANEDAYLWLLDNCSKFGFILRYPKNKTEITKIMFEPWHYRYVGRYHAERIMESGLCLEEYMASLDH